MKHTPTPWIYENRNGDDPGNTNDGWGTEGMWGANNELIMGTGKGWNPGFNGPSQDNIEFIVHTVNNIERITKQRDDLVEATKKLLEIFKNHIGQAYETPSVKKKYLKELKSYAKAIANAEESK